MQPESFRALEILHKYVIMYPIPKRMVILMKIDVITYRDKLYDNMLNGHTVIVIDVLRCTSAIIAALDNGAAKIIPAVEPGDATAYANRIGIKDCILGGERGCMILPGFNVGNSPFEYDRETVGGKTVIISTSNGTAAICGAGAAELYGLEILERGIETNKHNFTRFLLLADRSRAAGFTDPARTNKASLVFSLPHTQGSLSKVLSLLSFYEINLSKIQSLPIIGREWEYRFYVDVTFDDPVRYRQAIEAARPLTSDFRILGEYAECPNPAI